MSDNYTDLDLNKSTSLNEEDIADDYTIDET